MMPPTLPAHPGFANANFTSAQALVDNRGVAGGGVAGGIGRRISSMAYVSKRLSGALAASAAWLILALAPLTPADAVQGRLEALIRGATLGETRVSVVVMDLDRQQVLASIDPDTPMIPASNMKLITTAAALDVLGADHVFRTELLLVHADDDDDPSLMILGQGDPAFGDPVLLARHEPPLTVDDVLDKWVAAVNAAGVHHLARIIVDDSIFDRRFVHPTWPPDQLINRWAAPVAGLSFYLNTIDVTATAGDGSPRVELFPPGPFLETRNRARRGDRDAFWVSREPGTDRFTFHGTVQSRGTGPIEVSLHDPPMFLGRLLRHELTGAGLTVGPVRRRDELAARVTPTRPLHVVRTALPLVLMRTNQDSQNMFAEALLKAMGRAMTGEPGSWQNGAAAVRMALRQRLGPASAAVTVADGSGLSRDNRVTARLIVDLLRSMHHDEHHGRLWRHTLARAGDSGTLARRMGSLDAEIYAKTGYIRGVSGLSGYLVIPADDEPAGERTIAFSFLFNGFTPPLRNAHMRDLQDEMVAAVLEHLTARP